MSNQSPTTGPVHSAAPRPHGGGATANALTPALVSYLRANGYDRRRFARDLAAGLTVAVLALPLSMAIAIGAGLDPGKGLITSVVAGFFISALGGSRFQIGGPAAAFIVIVGAIVERHGAAGLATATFLAGLMLVLAGVLRVGTYIKYVPNPVITGFTSGIGIIIVVSQIKDFLGLTGAVPGEFIARIEALWGMRHTFNASAFTIAAATFVAIALLRRLAPRLPGLLIAVVGASGLAAWLNLPIETVGDRFPALLTSLPMPVLPDLAPSRIIEVLPSAFTLAFLIGVESLLAAVAADALAGTRHVPNAEVVAQGVANSLSPMFGGLPATGVIARTGTNITAGAISPIAGIIHAACVLVFVVLLGPLAKLLAMPCLAAVLVSVAFRLIDAHEVIRFLRRAPRDDALVLAATLVLTVIVDLNVAIAVGVVSASLLFMHRMAEATEATVRERVQQPPAIPMDADRAGEGLPWRWEPMPDGARQLDFNGPLFFGQSSRMLDALQQIDPWPHVLILRMRDVPLVDATAIGVLEDLARSCRQHGCRIIMSGLQSQPRAALHRYGFIRENRVVLASNGFIAVEKAKSLLAERGRTDIGGTVAAGAERG